MKKPQSESKMIKGKKYMATDFWSYQFYTTTPIDYQTMDNMLNFGSTWN